jgi:glycosyltransferase involved in cell wall biosynthesis
MMHVAVVLPFTGLGGAERSLVELVTATRDRLRWTVLVPDHGPAVTALTRAGARCRVVPWPDAVLDVGERAGRGSWRRVIAAATAVGPLEARLASELAWIAPDVVLTNGMKAHLVGARVCGRLGLPLVWYAREGLEDRPRLRLALRAFGRRPTGVIAISRYVASEFRAIVPGPAAIHVVRNIVDVRDARSGLERPCDLDKPAGATWVGVVGALTPLKGQEVFLRAAARVSERMADVEFLVVGGEPYRTEAGLGFGATLQRLARDLGIAARTRFLGERTDADAIIANLDLLVQSSRGPEGLGRTILEGMAAGVAVIGPDRWGPRELIEDGVTGLLVAPGDPVALADAIERLLRDPQARARLASAGRRAMQSVAPETIADAFVAALSSILGRTVGTPQGGVKEMAVAGR